MELLAMATSALPGSGPTSHPARRHRRTRCRGRRGRVTMAEWDADANVDAELAQVLVEPFASLRGASLRPLAEGWDVAAWLVADRYVFRFPAARCRGRGAATRDRAAAAPRAAAARADPRTALCRRAPGRLSVPVRRLRDLARRRGLRRFTRRAGAHCSRARARALPECTARRRSGRRPPGRRHRPRRHAAARAARARVARAARDRRPVARAADVDLQLIWSFSTMPAAPPFSTSTARSATRR